jgi:hypothetical protein
MTRGVKKTGTYMSGDIMTKMARRIGLLAKLLSCEERYLAGTPNSRRRRVRYMYVYRSA